eukprot:2586610-Pyramimonas_sp.AAC.1
MRRNRERLAALRAASRPAWGASGGPLVAALALSWAAQAPPGPHWQPLAIARTSIPCAFC